MPRLSGVPRNEAAPSVIPLYDLMFGGRDPVAEPGTATGAPGDWWTVFARVPAVFDHCVAGFALYQDPRRRLPAELRELGQTRAGWVVGSRFVFSQHCKSCRTAGIPEAKIAAIPHWEIADVFGPAERAVLAYTDSLTAGQGRVPDGIFTALREHLDEEQVLELTYITALYAMHGVMSRALRTEFDDVEDPVTEVPAPGSDQSFRV